jgi:phospholipase/carboxylesterase
LGLTTLVKHWRTVLLDTITIPSEQETSPTGLIVVLHGWGANAMDLSGIVSMLNLPDYTFIFPNAPLSHPQVEGGLMWYDLQNEYQGYEGSRQILQDWLNDLPEATGIPLSKTILSGFSQGAAMALDVGLSLPIAGIVAMSGYLHPIATQPSAPIPPILMLHGLADEVVPIAWAKAGYKKLLDLGGSVDYQTFEMGHEIRPEVIRQFETFVLKHSPRSQ